MTEKIAILMSTYNGEQYLSTQLQSIIDQDNNEWHLYIRDDGSSDKTCDIIRKFANENNSITFLNDGRIQNIGVAQSFMNLLENVNADFYMFSDQDDFWKKDKVTKTVDFMQTFDYKNQPIAVYTNLQVVDDKLIGDKALLNHNWQDFLALLFTNNAYGCTMMINNQLKKLINFKKLNFQNIYMHDWWLVLVAAAFGKVGYLDQKTILYRQHGDNQVGASEKSIFSYLYRVLNPRRDRTALKRTIGLATEFNNEYYDANLDKLIKKYLQGYGTLYKKSSFFNNLKLVSEYPPHSVYFLKKLYYGYIITFFYSDYKKG